MELHALQRDDEAVSPVIGVILMVAITVILAAVIASFVLGLGGETEVAPTTDFSFEYSPSSPEEITITHTGGDSIRADELYLRGEQLDGNSGAWGGDATGSVEGESAVVSGNSVTIDISGASNPDQYILRVVWESSQGDTSSELAVDRGPDA